MLKGYVDENNQIMFVCPGCGFEKSFNVSSLKNMKKKITLKCKCGQAMEMEIEFRKSFRKQVELFGVCTIRKNKNKCNVIVRDLSILGIGLEFMFIDRKLVKELKNGDLLTIEFELSGSKGNTVSTVTKECIIRLIIDLRVGVEFRDENFAKKIGFYLM